MAVDMKSPCDYILIKQEGQRSMNKVLFFLSVDFMQFGSINNNVIFSMTNQGFYFEPN